jgi:hypothetical protein
MEREFKSEGTGSVHNPTQEPSFPATFYCTHDGSRLLMYSYMQGEWEFGLVVVWLH